MSLLKGLHNAAARFVAVCAVIEFTAPAGFQHLRKKQGQFPWFYINQSELTNTGGIHKVASEMQGQQLGKGGGVDTFLVIVGDGASLTTARWFIALCTGC